MHENNAVRNPAASGELSLRLAAYRKELEQLTAEYPALMVHKMQERNDLVEQLKTENDAEKADALWKTYDNAGKSFNQWIAEYQNRIAELTKKIQETNDLLWKSQGKP